MRRIFERAAEFWHKREVRKFKQFCADHSIQIEYKDSYARLVNLRNWDGGNAAPTGIAAQGATDILALANLIRLIKQDSQDGKCFLMGGNINPEFDIPHTYTVMRFSHNYTKLQYIDDISAISHEPVYTI